MICICLVIDERDTVIQQCTFDNPSLGFFTGTQDMMLYSYTQSHAAINRRAELRVLIDHAARVRSALFGFGSCRQDSLDLDVACIRQRHKKLAIGYTIVTNGVYRHN